MCRPSSTLNHLAFVDVQPAMVFWARALTCEQVELVGSKRVQGSMERGGKEG